MEKLEGKTIVIAGSRKTEEMSLLIEKQGGLPVVRSLQGLMVFDEKTVEKELQYCAGHPIDWFIFTTGIGAESLLNAAKQAGVYDELVLKIQQGQVASRGYKTFAFLKKLEVTPDVVDDDGTSEGLLRELAAHDFKGRRVVVQLHGERQPSLIQFLEERGADVVELLLYQHIEPEQQTLETLCAELSEGQVDAVCFTTAVQVRYLFNYAKRHNQGEAVRTAFANKTLAAAVGKVTAKALQDEGVERVISPENERMGSMIIELVKYYQGLSNPA